MFQINVGETVANKRKIPFTVVQYTNLQARMTAMTGANLTVQVSVNGAAFATGTGTLTEIASGCYTYQLAAAEVATAGCVIIRTSGTRASDGAISEVREIAVQILPALVEANVASMSADTLTAAALAADAATEIVTAVFAKVVETTGGQTFLGLCRGWGAALLGKVSGWDTGTHIYRAADDSKARITATVGTTGRTAVTLDLT